MPYQALSHIDFLLERGAELYVQVHDDGRIAGYAPFRGGALAEQAIVELFAAGRLHLRGRGHRCFVITGTL